MKDDTASQREANRKSWNSATAAHNRHKPNQAEALASGQDPLFDEELALLGSLAGKKLVHLQCNSGQDTLGLARRGADVLGVDISDVAIEAASALSTASGIPARFHRSDVYDWLESTEERFDLALASYGALPWLPDLGRWAQGVHRILRPGGALVIVEFHPFACAFDEDRRLAWPAMTTGQGVEFEDGIGDYVAESGGSLHFGGEDAQETPSPFDNPHPCFEFAWGVGDVLSALLDAHLYLERLREYPHINGYKLYHDMVALPGRRWTLPEGVPCLPLMLGLRARKPMPSATRGEP